MSSNAKYIDKKTKDELEEERVEADHLRSLLVTAAISALYIADVFVSFMISHELYGIKWWNMLSITLIVLILPYVIVSSALLHAIYGHNFLCMKLDANPIHILFGVNCCNNINNNHNIQNINYNSGSCINKYINFIIKLLAFIITIFWLPILNIFICANNQYFNAILIQLSLILMNTINHLIILCIVHPQSILAMLSIISCRITIFYIVLSIFVFTYGHLSKRIINYKKYRYIASLTICIELLLAFIMIYITFAVKYDDNHYEQYIFTLFGFVNYIYPNFPFKKSRLIIKFAYNASQKWLLNYVLNGDINEMYNRFYFYLHHIIYHHSYNNNHEHIDIEDETVSLLSMDRMQQRQRQYNHNQHLLHHINDKKCIEMQFEYMRMPLMDKIPFIVGMVDSLNPEDKDKNSFLFDYGICRIIYFISSSGACLFPVIWLLVVFESTLVPGWMNILIYGSILMYMGFMGRMFYYFFKIKVTPNLLLLMTKINGLNARNVYNATCVDDNDMKYIVDMYKESKVIMAVMSNMDKEIGLNVLPYLLRCSDDYDNNNDTKLCISDCV